LTKELKNVNQAISISYKAMQRHIDQMF